MLFIFGWAAWAVAEGRYIEAVAIASVGSVFLWFALGQRKPESED
jgi:hypothetical protein